MLGNLKIYFGAATLDAYVAWLRTVGYLLVPHEQVLWGVGLG